jgi:L-fuculose-phosphate aldolase
MSTQLTAHPAFGAAAAGIVAGGRRLGARGLIAGSDGNLSVRLGPFALAVTPAGRRKDELEPGDILAVPLEPADAPGAPAHGAAHLRPSSDLVVHRAVYVARPAASAIAHAHPPAVLGCLLAGLVPDAAVLPEARAVLGRVAYVRALPLGSPEVAAATADALLDPAVGAVLLDRHGALAVGRTLTEAIDRLEVLELLCRSWHAAWLAGGDPRRRHHRRHHPAGPAGGPPRRR